MTFSDFIKKLDRMQSNAQSLEDTPITLERLPEETDEQFQEKAEKLVLEKTLEGTGWK